MTTNTMVALRSTTLASSASSVTLDLTGITGYTDLMIVCSPTNNQSINAADFTLNFNGDTTSGLYSQTILTANGSSAISKRNTGNNNSMYLTYYAAPSSGNPSTWIINIQNYANTTTYKTVLARGSNAASGIDATVGLWRNINAITSILVSNTVGTFSAGSTFTLYGIANADIGAYATGGIITQDSTYYYHAFGSSGTFTPSRALTADILVVAGGGGGGYWTGGGGGAGGVLANAAVSLASGTGYTCTVGAGGAGGNASNATNGGNSNVTGGSLSLTAAVGGGAGGGNGSGTTFLAGQNGGSGGGAAGNSGAAVGTGSQGSNGGSASSSGPATGAGGGGGFAVAGGAGSGSSGGSGGNGINTVTNWGTLAALVQAAGYGVNGYIAGGGAGGNNSNGTIATGGLGGGGNGSISTGSAASAGVPNTGSGGGGGGGNGSGTSTQTAGGNGGSGLIVLRYAK